MSRAAVREAKRYPVAERGEREQRRECTNNVPVVRLPVPAGFVDEAVACTTYRINPTQLRYHANAAGHITTIVTRDGQTLYRAEDVARTARLLHEQRARRAIKHQASLPQPFVKGATHEHNDHV